MIDWKEGAVCYAGGTQRKFGAGLVYWLRSDNKWIAGSHLKDLDMMLGLNDLQLNEPREGYYIPKSELDTEEKYNRAVKVFGLFGHYLDKVSSGFAGFNYHDKLVVFEEGVILNSNDDEIVKLTFGQLMAIGELKRKMNECDAVQKASDVVKKARESLGKPLVIATDSMRAFNEVAGKAKTDKSPKSKEAYRILESMGIEWDNVEGKWFKKEWL